MAVPAAPSVCSRAIYFPAQPAPGFTSVNPLAPNQVTYTPPAPSGDMAGLAAAGLPAIVIRVGAGASPDFAGTELLVFDQNGIAYTRSGMISTTSWAAAGSNPQVAHWALVDVVT
jgi:hypothetical protein